MSALACAVLAISTSVWSAMLPSEDQSTTIIASVGEQAVISVPDEISFDAGNVSVPTTGTGLLISATSIVLDDGNALRIELKADAADFDKPGEASVTWAASDVSWDAPAWTGGTGAAGTLSSEAYTKVADSAANATELSSDAITWTLAPKAVDRAGSYTLTTTWKFSSFTP